MLRPQSKQSSFHSLLYNKIPENHILKQIKNAVDFSFINELLKDSYCVNFGRPAKEPELMCKLLFLQHIYDLSDEKVIEEASFNLTYLYFLDVNPEDTLPERSLLSKFRKLKLGEQMLDEIIIEIVRQCVEKGILKKESVSIDATHVEANTIKKTPERLMKHLARKIIKSYQEETKESLENLPEVPDYQEISDHKEAKKVMKDYLETVIAIAGSSSTLETPETSQIIEKAKEILDEPKFMNQTGIRSLIDEDARVGRKSKTSNFFGYKVEFIMTTDQRIITAVRTANGAYVDGSLIKELLGDTLSSGLTITEFYGDKAYFRKSILEKIDAMEAEAYIPVSGSAYRIDESEFSYNKDSDQWFCSQGNQTVSRKYYKRKRKDCKSGFQEGHNYYFDVKICKSCPKHDQCAKKSARKILNIGINTLEFYEISQSQKTDEFKEKYKKRASIEGKNAELKRFHGLGRAKSYGLVSVSKQAKLAAIAVNLKRIAAIMTAKSSCFFEMFVRIRINFVF
ncbi:IS1182 family transposase ISAme2 [anaerobic digester metagenome]